MINPLILIFSIFFFDFQEEIVDQMAVLIDDKLDDIHLINDQIAVIRQSNRCPSIRSRIIHGRSIKLIDHNGNNQDQIRMP